VPDAPRPFPESLCHQCVHLRLVSGARSSFLRCAAPAMPKYAPQPVATCRAFERSSR
jgi:hypothetical protein